MSTLKALLSCLLLVLCFSPASAFNQTSVPPMPSTNTASTAQVVKPGENHTNTDGVTVKNDKASKGNARIDPKTGTEESETTVTTKNGFCGSVDGTDGNDTINIGANNDATVEGKGGTVIMAGSSKLTVKNTAPAGGDNITVIMPSGGTVTVPPGSTSHISS